MADRPRPEPSEPRPNRRARLGSAAPGLGAAATLAALGVLGWSAVTTASARIAGSTSSGGSLLQAASVSLQRNPPAGGGGGSALSSDLLVDADGLYPGVVVERCLPVRYAGSLDDVPLVLSARISGGTGLERYLDTAVDVGTGDDPACGDFAPTPADGTWGGTLAALASTHPRYERGLELAGLGDGQAVTVRFRFEVLADDGAQGRSTAVHLRFEVRP